MLMINSLASYLGPPPRNVPLFDVNDQGLPQLDERGFPKLTQSWIEWLDQIEETTGYVICHNRFNDTKIETVTFQVTSLTQNRRNNLQNLRNGIIIYNEDTNKLNCIENGAWREITTVPA
jgi:hypothetical protein